MKSWNNQISVDDLIVYEDDSLLIINKPPTVSSQPDHSQSLDILTWAQDLKKCNYHMLTRLDRPVSGLIALCKLSNAQRFAHQKFLKKYLAVVPSITEEEVTLRHFISRDGRKKKALISESNKEGYKPCELSHRLFCQLENYSVIEVFLTTGRFHQIRAQLSFAGLPIRGDIKYGARRKNKDRSIDLHAYSIEIPGGSDRITAKPIMRNSLWSSIADIRAFT